MAEKSGLVADFRICDGNYLKLIYDDLALGCSFKSFCSLQQLYRAENRDPTVADLYFDAAAFASAAAAPDALSVSSVTGENRDIAELFSDLTDRYFKAAPRRSGPPSLTELAEFACAPVNDTDAVCTLSVAGAPVTPPYPEAGRAEFYTGAGYTLSLSHGCSKKPVSGLDGYLIMPPEGMPHRVFSHRVHGVFGSLVKLYPEAALLPASCRGLLWDIEKLCDGCCIYVSGLPGGDGTPRAALLPVNPGCLIFIPEYAEKDIIARCFEDSLTVRKTVTQTDMIKSFIIRGDIIGEASETGFTYRKTAVLTRRHINAYRRVVPFTLGSEPGELSGSGFCDLTGTAAADIDCISLAGNPYEALKDSITFMSRTVIAGTLNPRDPGVIPLIVTLDAFRRNTNMRIIGAGFFIGDKTDITLFRFNS